jgi:hypothetical protein
MEEDAEARASSGGGADAEVVAVEVAVAALAAAVLRRLRPIMAVADAEAVLDGTAAVSTPPQS